MGTYGSSCTCGIESLQGEESGGGERRLGLQDFVLTHHDYVTGIMMATGIDHIRVTGRKTPESSSLSLPRRTSSQVHWKAV